MATKAKKNFLSALQDGEARDQQMRSATLSRFDNVATAMDGRDSLLQPHQSDPESSQEREGEAGFYVETLVKEGKATRRQASIQIDLIDDNPLNSRKFYNEEKIKARANSIKADGQLVPAFVAPHPKQPGRYQLIDGHYRKRATLHLGRPEMSCWVLDGLSPIDFYRLAHTLNNEREQETFLDVAFSYRQLLDAGIARTEEDLIPIVGESKSKINKMLALTGLPQSVLDVIIETPEAFGYNIGYELTLLNKAAGEARTTELAKRIVEEELSFKKVEAIRKKAEEGAKARRNTSRQYKIMRDGQAVGTLKEWDNGRVTLDMTFDDAAKREAYVASMKHQLELDEPT